ncbi:vitamin K epoxide reductase family protein [Flavobacteriaceae bacterium 14752]|uniref:vitamin K epoxide reductase family protein n=1 Tax=Mesohalobacter salilacus TaxID=2491711 RepID=UPI000F63C00D|nr:hypothetical protein EIG84_03585 [Flavobacteriaceae bacterium 14752]
MSFSSHILHEFVELNKYDVSFAEINRLLKSDISDGMQPITNTLDLLDIPNLAIELPKSSFNQLPNCFIAQVKQDEKYNFVLVCKAKDDNNVEINYGDNEKNSKAIDEFLEHWTGKAIVAEENKNLKKPSLEGKDFYKVTLIVGIVLLLSYLFRVYNDLTILIYAIFSFIGFGLSLLILKEKYGNIGQPSQYCSINNNTSCNAVLNSKYAKLFNTVDLSDVTVVYFAFITLGLFSGALNVLHLSFSVLSIPIIIYSVYFQYFKIQKWCPLCLGIAFVLVAQSVLLGIDYTKSLSMNTSQFLYHFSLLAVILVAWFHIKTLLKTYSKYEGLMIENLKFRRNHKLFVPFYDSLKPIESEIDQKFTICLGNKNTANTITIITNPFCQFCKKAHKTYMELLNEHQNDIQFKVVFLLTERNPNKIKVFVLKNLVGIYKEQGELGFAKALNDWFESRNPKQWLERWEVNTKNTELILKEHIKWCNINNILKTPSILLNGKLFPESYHITDIKHFIEPIFYKHTEYNNTLASKT